MSKEIFHRKVKRKECVLCDRFYFSASNRSKYCKRHREEVKKRKNKQYRKRFIERIGGFSEFYKKYQRKYEKLTGRPIGKHLIPLVGKKNPNWKGGITPLKRKIRVSIEFDLWRQAVFARDNWTCQKYGIKGGKLHSHHIKNFADYPELRFAIDNGITFSEKAHREFHKKYGFKDNTMEQLNEFLKQ